MIFRTCEIVAHVNAELGGKVKDSISLKSYEKETGVKIESRKEIMLNIEMLPYTPTPTT